MPYVCPFCNRRFKTMSSLVRHVRIEHASDNVCPCCGARASSNSKNWLVLHAARMASSRADLCHMLVYIATVSRPRTRLARLAYSLVSTWLRTN